MLKRIVLIINLLVFSSVSSAFVDVRGVLNADGSSSNTVAIYIADIVTPQMSQKVIGLIGNLPLGKDKVIFYLNSMGGSMAAGLQIIAGMEALKSMGIQVITAVINGNTCGSICVPMFLHGEKRYAGEVTSWFFHGVAMADMPKIVDYEETKKGLDAFFIAEGVPKSWIDKMWKRGAFSGTTPYWMTSKELFAENALIITNLISRTSIGVPVDK